MPPGTFPAVQILPSCSPAARPRSFSRSNLPMRCKPLILLAMMLGLSAHAEPIPYEQQIERQRQAREERLQRPAGWLSLVGLHWIEPGRHTLGSAPDNGIVLAVGPAHLGTLQLDAGGLRLEPAAGAQLLVDGSIVEAPFRLLP